MRPGSHITRRAIAALVVGAALVAPAQAGAATASLSGATLNVNSGNEASDVTVTISGSNFVIADNGADVTAGSACAQTADTPKKVTCPTAGVTTLGAVLNGGVDKLDTSAVPLTTNVNSGAGADRIVTGAGNDAINGDLDDDSIDGGLGDDNLIGGGGGDTLVYASHTMPVTVSLGTNQQSTQTTGNGQSGENDTVLQFEYMLGGQGDDTLSGDGNDNFISGGLGSDTLSGGAGNDYVGYWERTDNVTVQLGQSVTPGTGGASAGGEADVIAVDFENAMGGVGDDVIIGNDSDNVLWGGWSESAAGEDGDDVLRGKGGSDYLWGDEGSDTADYSDKTALQPVTATLDGAANDGASGEGDTINTDVENVTGGAGADNLTGNTGANTIRGGAGNDIHNGGAGDDVLDGGTGADVFNGGTGIDRADYSTRGEALAIDIDGLADDAGEGDNVKTDVENLTGGSGNDTLTGSGVANAIDGGPGDDTLRGGLGADTYAGGSGTDTVDYSDKSSVNASIDGVANDGGDGDNVGTDVENLSGTAGADTLTGDGDANSLIGLGGNDTLNGAGGDDILQGGLGADALNGGSGADTADYSDKTSALTISLDDVSNDPDGDTIGTDVENATGGSADDTLTGNASANRLAGGAGNDSIDGGTGGDTITAGDGDDFIAARQGAVDTIFCGAGADSGLADTDDVLSGDCESTLEKPAPPPVDPPPVDPPVVVDPVVDPPVVQPPVEEPPVGQPPVDEPPIERNDDGEAPVEITTPAAMVLSAKGDLSIGVSCTAETGLCKGTIELIEQNDTIKARSVVESARRRKVKKGTVLGRRNFSIRAGRKKKVQLRLDRRGRQRVIKKKKRKTRAKLVITMKAADGTKTTTEKNVTISPPKERRTAKRGGKKKARR